MRKATACPRPVLGKALHNKATGELLPLPCNTWGCAVCGPAKAYRLGLLAAAAGPERFVTLSMIGPNLELLYRRFQTLSQALRRAGYGWEYLAVPEVHENGSWHLHLLQRGSYIPQRVLSSRADSAGMGYVVDIRRIRDAGGEVPRYLNKYLTKQALSSEISRSKFSKRFRTSRGFWPGGREAVEAKAFGVKRHRWELAAVGPFVEFS